MPDRRELAPPVSVEVARAELLGRQRALGCSCQPVVWVPVVWGRYAGGTTAVVHRTGCRLLPSHRGGRGGRGRRRRALTPVEAELRERAQALGCDCGSVRVPEVWDGRAPGTPTMTHKRGCPLQPRESRKAR